MRSGTTLLRHMLGSHPAIFVPEESHFIPYLYRESQSRGRFPVEWLFSPRANIRHFPRVGDYIPQAPWAVARSFGRKLRLVPLNYGFDRRQLEAFLGREDPGYTAIVRWMFERALQHDPLIPDPGAKRLFGDKTPHYVRTIATLRALYPDAVILHMVRDGRAVLASKSVRKRLIKPMGPESNRICREIRALCPHLKIDVAVFGFRDDSWMEKARNPLHLGVAGPLPPRLRRRLGPRVRRLRELWQGTRVETRIAPMAVPYQARVWMEDVRAGEKGADCTVRYEGLVRCPKPVLERICRLLDVEPQPQMLRYYRNPNLPLLYASDFGDLPGNRDIMKPPRTENIDKWRRILSPETVAEFEAVAGPALRELGYL